MECKPSKDLKNILKHKVKLENILRKKRFNNIKVIFKTAISPGGKDPESDIKIKEDLRKSVKKSLYSLSGAIVDLLIEDNDIRRDEDNNIIKEPNFRKECYDIINVKSISTILNSLYNKSLDNHKNDVKNNLDYFLNNPKDEQLPEKSTDSFHRKIERYEVSKSKEDFYEIYDLIKKYIISSCNKFYGNLSEDNYELGKKLDDEFDIEDSEKFFDKAIKNERLEKIILPYLEDEDAMRKIMNSTSFRSFLCNLISDFGIVPGYSSKRCEKDFERTKSTKYKEFIVSVPSDEYGKMEKRTQNAVNYFFEQYPTLKGIVDFIPTGSSVSKYNRMTGIYCEWPFASRRVKTEIKTKSTLNLRDEVFQKIYEIFQNPKYYPELNLTNEKFEKSKYILNRVVGNIKNDFLENINKNELDVNKYIKDVFDKQASYDPRNDLEELFESENLFVKKPILKNKDAPYSCSPAYILSTKEYILELEDIVKKIKRPNNDSEETYTENL